MIALLLTLCIAFAGEAPDLDGLLDLAHTLEDDGQSSLARRTRIVVADSDEATEDQRLAAEDALRAMPGLPGGASPATVRLFAWHAIAGVALPPLAISSFDNQPRGGAQVGLSILGGSAAVAGSFVYAKHVRITPARTTAIVGIQQLGALHGAAFGSMVQRRGRDWFGRYASSGAAIGGAISVVPALLVGQLRLDDRRMVTAYSGAVWGAAIAGALKAGQLVKPSQDARGDFWTVTAGADIGALLGYGLGGALGLTRDEIRMANIAGMFGLASTYLFGWSTQYDILWTAPAYTLFAIGGSLVGAAGGVLIVRRFARPSGGKELAWMPTVTPTREGAVAGVALRF